LLKIIRDPPISVRLITKRKNDHAVAICGLLLSGNQKLMRLHQPINRRKYRSSPVRSRVPPRQVEAIVAIYCP
jgi:hypothetical protein